VGDTVWITDESQMDAVTAISGSGPAYVFYFIEAVEEAAGELGLPVAIRAPPGARYLHRRGQARRFESRPGGGAARARHLQGRHHRAGLASMAKDEVKAAVIRAIHAANERGKSSGKSWARNEGKARDA